MVLVVDSARRRAWHGNAASTRSFRWSRPHDCGNSFAAGYRHFVIYGPCPTLRRGILSISYFCFPLLFAAWPLRIPVTLPAHCAGCGVGCHQLANDGLLGFGIRYECTCRNEGEVERASGQNVTALSKDGQGRDSTGCNFPLPHICG